MLRFLTAGESHGPELTAIVEGLPAALPLDLKRIDRELKRRQTGYGSGERMRIEKDQVRISSGVFKGKSTGAPLALKLKNRDWENWRKKDISPMTIPRPGHADLNATLKYAYDDLRAGLERASARETAARVAVGALCKIFLENFNIRIGSYIAALGPIKLPLDENPDHQALCLQAEGNDLRCPDEKSYPALKQLVDKHLENQDTLGGIGICVALNVPVGLGSHVHYDRRLDGILMGLFASIPAVKGVSIGAAFEHSTLSGSALQDEIFLGPDKDLVRNSNRAGGIEGGISTGQPLVVHFASKALSSTRKGLRSVDLKQGREARHRYERSDVLALPRACVVSEAVMAFALARALLEKLGGDHLDEMKERFAKLPRNSLDHVHLSGEPFRFDDFYSQ
jgi:chorismate synthase